MIRPRRTLAAAFAALLLAAPAAATGRPTDTTAVERALAQERAYTQQADRGRNMTAVERALAQERTYTQQANADPKPARAATAAHGGVSTELLAGSIAAGLLLAAAGGLAAIAVRRRHARDAAALLPAR
jgi:hypothetical protein